jgi:hypothetical protein
MQTRERKLEKPKDPFSNRKHPGRLEKEAARLVAFLAVLTLALYLTWCAWHVCIWDLDFNAWYGPLVLFPGGAVLAVLALCGAGLTVAAAGVVYEWVRWALIAPTKADVLAEPCGAPPVDACAQHDLMHKAGLLCASPEEIKAALSAYGPAEEL